MHPRIAADDEGSPPAGPAGAPLVGAADTENIKAALRLAPSIISSRRLRRPPRSPSNSASPPAESHPRQT